MLRTPACLVLFAALLLPASPGRAAESHAGGEAAGPAYVRLQPMTVSVIGPSNQVDREVHLMIDLELETGKTEQMFEPYRRSILDNFVVTLKGLYDEQYEGASVPPDELKESLLVAANEVTGPGLVHSVLLVSIGERRMR